MNQKTSLDIDGIANLLFGVLLLIAPRSVFEVLGLPWTERTLWALILGGVLTGIGVALLMEARRTKDGLVGLGLGGAVAINLGGAAGIALWLLLGTERLPVRGSVVLTMVVVFLVGLSSIELLTARRRNRPA